MVQTVKTRLDRSHLIGLPLMKAHGSTLNFAVGSHTFLTSNFDFFLSNVACEISGRKLHELDHELRAYRRRQHVLRGKIESALAGKTLGDGYGRLAAQFFAENTAEAAKALDDYLQSLGIILSELLDKLADAGLKIVKLSRRVKALKRAMRRRQRILFCGLTASKRVWYLMHGSHPPKTRLDVNHLLQSGGARI